MHERITVRLPSDLLIAARQKAAADNRTLTSLIEEGLRIVVEENARPMHRKLPRVSTATGGFAPGMDLPYSALEELEDLEYVERMKRLK
jgi:hypothetical protein